jgi:phospholipid/cholesterol/gamma-HCH transport system substrate-binding protein
MIGTDDVQEYASVFRKELGLAIEDLGKEDGKGALNKTLNELQKTVENMAKLTATTNRIMAQSAANLTQTISNMSDLTGNLAKYNDQITSMLQNFNTVSRQIKDANVGNTITQTTTTIEASQKAIKQLQTTISGADDMMKNLNSLIAKASSGDGTLAKLLNDKKLYNNLEMTSKNMSLLLQDLRLNPSRYVKVSVFGGKNKDKYVKPENDPAFQND